MVAARRRNAYNCVTEGDAMTEANMYGAARAVAVAPMSGKDAARFESRILPETSAGCWPWGGTITHGYGVMSVGGRHVRAPRLAYAHYVAPVSDGLLVLHKCDNPVCVNPSHLFLGTQHDNMLDCRSKGRAAKARGEASGNAKLTEEQVRDLRARVAAGETKARIARELGVTERSVRAAFSGETWAHVNAAVSS